MFPTFLSTTSTLNSTMNPKLLLLCVALATSPSWAAVKYPDYIKAKDTPTGKGYMAGLVVGLQLANHAMQRQTGQALFCVPPGSNVNREVANLLISEYAEVLDSDSRKEVSVEVLLIEGLKQTFPCGATSAPR